MSEPAIAVLGATVDDAGQPKTVLSSRLALAARIAQRYPHAPIVVSGRGEAPVMRDRLTAAGIPADRIHVEAAATSTNENLENIQHVLPETTEWIIITSDFHKPRTYLWARHLGLRARVIAARTPQPWRRLGPTYLREAFALVHSLTRIAWRRLH